MANMSLHRRSETDWTQPIFGLTGLPRGLPCLPFTLRPVDVSNMCTGAWTCGGTLCWTMSPDCAFYSWTVGSKCGEDMQRAMPIAALLVKQLLLEAVWWFGAASPSLEKQGLSSSAAILKQRDIEMRFCNRRQFHISTVWDWTLSSRMTTPPQTGFNACLKFWPQAHWKLVVSA